MQARDFQFHQVRAGLYPEIMRKRNETLRKAYQEHSQRWSSSVKQYPEQHVVYLNPSIKTMEELGLIQSNKEVS